jgi:hypothetical protein
MNKQVKAVLVNGTIYDSLSDWARQNGIEPEYLRAVRKAFNIKNVIKSTFDGITFEKTTETSEGRKARKGWKV